MTLESWIKWSFVPCPRGRHPFHSHALCRQAARDMGMAIDHDDFLAAMKAAGYRVNVLAWQRGVLQLSRYAREAQILPASFSRLRRSGHAPACRGVITPTSLKSPADVYWSRRAFSATWPEFLYWATSSIFSISRNSRRKEQLCPEHEQSYLMQDEKQRERLQALANSPNTLEDERILCKLLCEQAANAGHAGLAAMIAQTIAKIARIEVQNSIDTGRLISREQAFALIRSVVDAVTCELENRFVGWEDTLEKIADRIQSVTQQKPLQLEDQR